MAEGQVSYAELETLLVDAMHRDLALNRSFDWTERQRAWWYNRGRHVLTRTQQERRDFLASAIRASARRAEQAALVGAAGALQTEAEQQRQLMEQLQALPK